MNSSPDHITQSISTSSMHGRISLGWAHLPYRLAQQDRAIRHPRTTTGLVRDLQCRWNVSAREFLNILTGLLSSYAEVARPRPRSGPRICCRYSRPSRDRGACRASS